MVDEAYRRYYLGQYALDNAFKRWCVLSIIAMAVTGVIFAFFPGVVTAALFVCSILSLRIDFLRYDQKTLELQEELKNAHESIYGTSQSIDQE
jgi:hypothetical protein